MKESNCSLVKTVSSESYNHHIGMCKLILKFSFQEFLSLRTGNLQSGNPCLYNECLGSVLLTLDDVCSKVCQTMGLTKQYLRYQPCGKFNVIGSTWARLVTLNAANTSEPVCAVGACEDVQLWNFRTSTKVALNLVFFR